MHCSISVYSDFTVNHLCKDVDVLSNLLLPSKKFCPNFLHFRINLLFCFYGFTILASMSFILLFLIIFFLFSLFGAFLYICTVLVFFFVFVLSL